MVAMATAYNRYKEHDVMMANPMELIVMLYNGCIKQLKLAKIAIDDKDVDKANGSLQKAQDIVMELMMSLDMSYEVSKELMNLYEFMAHEIGQVNVTKNPASIGPLVEMLTSLRDAWVQVQKQTRMPAAQLSEN